MGSSRLTPSTCIVGVCLCVCMCVCCLAKIDFEKWYYIQYDRAVDKHRSNLFQKSKYLINTQNILS